MKIAVCVKQVPDATVHKRIDPATKRLDRSGEGALNPTDLNAVEEALRIKEAQGGEVVLVSLGPEKAAESLDCWPNRTRSAPSRSIAFASA